MEKIKRFDWINILRSTLLVIFVFYANFYPLNSFLLKMDKTGFAHSLQTLSGFEVGMYLVSIAGLALYLAKYLSVSFIKRIGTSYLLYLVVSYFLLVTRNINNEKFKLWQFSKYHFFENNFLITLFAILLLSFLIRYFFEKNKNIKAIEKFLSDYQSNDIILLGLLASIAVNDYQALGIFRDMVKTYMENNNYLSYMQHSIINLFMSLAAMGLIFYFVNKSYSTILKNKPTPSLIVTSSVFLALIFNYTIQLGVQKDEPLLNRFIFPGATAYQILVLACLFILFYAVIDRFLATTLIIITLGTILSIVNSIKVGLRSEPLLISDFVWLKELSLLTSFVDTSLIIYAVIGIILVVGLYFLLRKYILPGKIFTGNHLRIGFISALSVLFVFVFLVFRNEKEAKIAEGIPLVSKVNNWVDINWMGFSTNASYKSLMYVWTKQMTKSVMTVPDDYSEEKVQKIAKKYQKKAEQINKSRPNDIQDQTVIYILSESFSDPARVPGVTLSQNVIPNISQVKADYTSGLMTSDFYGGGTANMEIQSLTGLPYTNLSSSVSVMNTEVLPKMSYVPTISNAFKDKNKIAVHLHNGANYSRNIVYRDFGFDTFVALDGTDDKPTQLENDGANASDKSTYYAVTSLLSQDTPQFFSVITMQNHIPWEKDEPTDISGTVTNLNATEIKTLSSYARLLNDTDQMTSDFLDQLKSFNKKITVVFYGDHLPGLYPASSFKSDPDSQFQTDYFIWSNYETEKLNYPNIRSNDFPALLLKQTDSKVSPYYALLTDVLDSKDKKDRSNKDLKIIQYDLTLGKGYIMNNKRFFKTK